MATLDYRTPDQKPPRNYARQGAILGAIGLPSAFVFVSVLARDAGGPCFWPMAVVIGGVIGWAIGSVIQVILRR